MLNLCDCVNLIIDSCGTRQPATVTTGISAVDQYLVLAIALFGILTFVLLLFLDAPYGKFHDARWNGISVNGKWAFAVQEAGSPIVFALTVWYYMSNSGDSAAAVWSKLWSNGPAPLLCMLMFQIHYIHRAFIFPLKTVSMNDSKLFVMLMALVFTCVNGYLNAKYLLLFQNQVPTLSVLLGIVLFALGMWQNIACDNHLIALRARRAQPSGEKDRVTSGEKETMTSGEKDLVTTGVTKVHRQYFIPTVGLFHWVSAGNYLGEMIEWIGFAVSSQNCASITFALFTFTNLFPRALSTHRYYLEKFRGEYPKNRKAIIPFLL